MEKDKIVRLLNEMVKVIETNPQLFEAPEESKAAVAEAVSLTEKRTTLTEEQRKRAAYDIEIPKNLIENNVKHPNIPRLFESFDWAIQALDVPHVTI